MLPFGGSFLLTLNSLFSVVLLSYCTTVLPPYFLLLGFFSFLYPLENSSRKIHFAPLSGFFYQFSQSAGKERDFIPIGQKGNNRKIGVTMASKWLKCFEVREAIDKAAKNSQFQKVVEAYPSYSMGYPSYSMQEIDLPVDDGLRSRPPHDKYRWEGGIPRQQKLIEKEQTWDPGKLCASKNAYAQRGDIGLLLRLWKSEDGATGPDEDSIALENTESEEPLTLEELHKAAHASLDIFKKLIIEVTEEAGIDASTQVIFPSMKSKERCRQKAAEDYNGDFSRILDVVRCSVLANNNDELITFLDALKRAKSEGFEVVRLKNRFGDGRGRSQLGMFGYRDALINVAMEVQPGVIHVCEIQLHVASYAAKYMRATYEYCMYYRTYLRRTLPTSTLKMRERVLLRVAEAAKKDAKMKRPLLGKRARRFMEALKNEAIAQGSELELQALDELFQPDRLDEVWLRADVVTHLTKLRGERHTISKSRAQSTRDLERATAEARELLAKLDLGYNSLVGVQPLEDQYKSEMEMERATWDRVGGSEEGCVEKDADANGDREKSVVATLRALNSSLQLFLEIREGSVCADDEVLIENEKKQNRRLYWKLVEHRFAKAQGDAKAGNFARARTILQSLIQGVEAGPFSFYEQTGLLQELRTSYTKITNTWIEELDAKMDARLHAKYEAALSLWSGIGSSGNEFRRSALEESEDDVPVRSSSPTKSRNIATVRRLLREVLNALNANMRLEGTKDEMPVLSSFPTKSEKVATVCGTLGLIELKAGSPEEAHWYLLKSLHYLEVSLGKRHLETAQAYICVGEAARLAGWVPKARAHCRQALWIGLSLSGFESEHGVTSDVSAYELVEAHPSRIVALAYRALGLCERDAGAYKNAEALFMQALNVLFLIGLAEEEKDCAETKALIEESAALLSAENKKLEKKRKCARRSPSLFGFRAEALEPTGDPKSCPCRSCSARRSRREELERAAMCQHHQEIRRAEEAYRAEATAAKKLETQKIEAERLASAPALGLGDLCRWAHEDDDIPAGTLGTVEALGCDGAVTVRFANGELFTLASPDLVFVPKTWHNHFHKDYSSMTVRLHNSATMLLREIYE